MTVAAVGLAAVVGLASPGVRVVELAFVLLLGGCATGAVALLGAWGRRDR